MTGKGFGCVGIMEKGILVGIITDGDLRRHMDGGLLGLTAERVMSRNPITVDEHCLAAKALGIMQSSKITSLYVARGGEPVGILSVHDCLRAGLIDVYDIALPDGGCLTVVCGCAVQQGGRGEKSGVAAQETRYAGFASQLGEQMEGTIASVEKTPLRGPLRFQWASVCFRAPDAVPQGHIDGSPQEMTVAVCRRPSEEWTLVEPIFEPLPR